jgi:putative endonuclease
MFTVYVLRSLKTGRFYTGSASNVEFRLSRHEQGLSPSTKHGRPWELGHREEFNTRGGAVRRERYLKTGKGREELRRLLEKAGKL